MKRNYEAVANVNIHNDLGNCAYHFKKRFEQWDGEGEITLEIMAALTMLAFTNEARINVLGQRVVPDWNERAELKSKIRLVIKTLGVQADLGGPPYQTLISLNKFRDSLAHGKPETLQKKGKVEIKEDFNMRNVLPNADWEKQCSVDNFNRSYDNSQTVWYQLLAAAGLKELDLSDNGSFCTVDD